MSNTENDDNAPTWLSEENDDKHRKEFVPLLFGEGKLDLKDPESPPEPEASAQPEAVDASKSFEEEILEENIKKGAENSNTKTYGSVDETKKKSVESGEGSDRPALSDAALAAKPHVPPINPCLWMFHLLQGITVVASLCLITTQLIPLFITPHKDIMAKIGLLAIALKVYNSLFCLLFILVEIDVPSFFFVQDSTLLQRFFSRGFIYSFVGLICVEEAYSERMRDIVAYDKTELMHVGWAAIFMQISSWLMLATGVTYMLLGMCCLKRLKDKMREDEITAWRKYRKDLKEWKDLYE